VRFAAAVAVFAAAPAIAAAPLTPTEVAHFKALAAQCTGGYYGSPSDEPKAPGGNVTAADMATRLPRAGPQPRVKHQGHDAFSFATAFLSPVLQPDKTPWTGKSDLTCPVDAGAGVRLLQWIIGDGGDDALYPSDNALLWLGFAARDGVGMPKDAALARQYFLHARIVGLTDFGPEYWGSTPNETLVEALARPEARAVLDLEADAGRPAAQMLVADLIAVEDPKRARALLERAATNNIIGHIHRRLAEAQLTGLGAPPDGVAAVRTLAPLAFERGDPNYEAMLAAATAYNGGPVQEAKQVPTIEDFGGKAWLNAGLKLVELDSIYGSTPARGLLAPDGSIVFVEVVSPRVQRYSIDFAMLKVFNPKRLPRLQPEMVDGRPVFAWVKLPTLSWR
jgi:hypothetical protein